MIENDPALARALPHDPNRAAMPWQSLHGEKDKGRKMCLQCAPPRRLVVDPRDLIAILDKVVTRKESPGMSGDRRRAISIPARTRGIVVERSGAFCQVLFPQGDHATIAAADLIRMGPTIGMDAGTERRAR